MYNPRDIEAIFGRTAKKCEGHKDDRNLFVNCYNQLLKAVKEANQIEVESPILRIGLSQAVSKQYNELERLEQSLIDREMI